MADRSRLWRWLGWFGAANGLLFALIGLLLLRLSGFPDSFLAGGYLLLAWLGHYAALAAVPLVGVGAIFILIAPRRAFVIGIPLVLAALMAAVLFMDAQVYGARRFHLSFLTVQILDWKFWLYAALALVAALLIQAQIARWAWNFVASRERRGGWLWLAGLAAAWMSAQAIHIWADARYYTPVTGLSDYLAAYRPLTARGLLTRYQILEVSERRQQALAEQPPPEVSSQALSYPRQPLQCRDQARHNLLLIVVNSMRGHALDPEFTPRLSAFAEQRGTVFQRHYTGGTSSALGLFSLLYGIPASYRQAFESRRQPAVLVEQFRRNGHPLGIFTSATLLDPLSLDRTAFARIADLRLATEPVTADARERDRRMTDDWLAWLATRTETRPFFGFLYYDAPAHAGSHVPVEMDAEATPAQPYRQALRFNDGLIAEVLDDLDRRGLLQQTLVMLTADHGVQADRGIDTLSGEPVTEPSGYNHRNLHVPMVLARPGQEPASVAYRTSHYDVVPTILEELFDCANPVTDYAVGDHLLDGEPWPWLVVSGPDDTAILSGDQVIISAAAGLVEVRDSEDRVVQAAAVDPALLEQVLGDASRFNQP